MKGIIFAASFPRGLVELEKMEESYIRCGHTLTRKRQYELEFDNGDRWQLFAGGFDRSARGSRCNIVYIDCRIDNDAVERDILPCLNGSPYNAIHYFS